MNEPRAPETVLPLPAAPPEGQPHAAAPLLQAAAERHAKLAALLAEASAAAGEGGGGGAEPGLDDADVVHDLRVASRRLGEVARLLADFVDKPTAKAVEASLKSLRRAMGDLRDSDVTREHLARWRMPRPLKALARELAATFEAQRPELTRAVGAVMASASVQGAMVVLARVIETHAAPACAADSEKRLEGLVATQLRKRAKAVRRAFGKAARRQTPESLHAARVAIKKLRYVSELAEEAKLPSQRAGGNMKRQVRFLKQMQELLGDHHDAHVILTTLEAHLRDPHPLRGLVPAWRKWRSAIQQDQARRATLFFMKTYTWINP